LPPKPGNTYKKRISPRQTALITPYLNSNTLRLQKLSCCL